MEDPVDNGKRVVQAEEVPALDRIASLEQAGLLERCLGRCRLDPRRRRLAQARLEDIRRRRAAWQPPDDRVTLPVVLWDGQDGWPVTAWLAVGWNETPALSPGWSGLTDATKSALTQAGIHTATWLRARTGVEIHFLPHRVSLSILAAAGGPLPGCLVMEGPSFTGAFAVALLSLWTDRSIPSDTWVFGQFSQSGHLAQVGRLAEKLDAVIREELPCRAVIAVAPSSGSRLVLPGEQNILLPPGAPFEQLVSAAWPGGEDRLALAPLFRAEAGVEAMLDPLENRMQLHPLDELADWMDRAKASGRLRFRARRALGAVASRLGDIAAARAAMEEALAIGRGCLDAEGIDVWDYTELCNNLGVLFTDLHEWGRAQKWLEEGIRRLAGTRGYTVREQEGRLRSSLGQMELWRGRPERAEPLLRQAMASLGEGRNLNYLAGSLVCRHHAAARGGRKPSPEWLMEAADLLAQSRRWPRFHSEMEYLFHRAFVLYWETRLAYERGAQLPGILEEVAMLRRQVPRSVFPLTGAACWIAATDSGPARSAASDGMALTLLGELAREEGVILRLLALGWATRLWAAGLDGQAIVRALSGRTGGKTIGEESLLAGMDSDRSGYRAARAGHDRKMVRCVLDTLELLEPLSKAFAEETAWCRERLGLKGRPASRGRYSSNAASLKSFLSDLSEKIAY